MAVFKPTNCSPYLTSFDITYLNEGPIYFQCKIDTSNTNIDGYAITVYDSDNHKIFPFSGNAVDNISYIKDLKADTQRIDSIIETNGVADLNTGLNGSYLKIPFVVNDTQNKKLTNTTKKNVVVYNIDGSSKITDNSGNSIELHNGNQYKWTITLYQLGQSAVDKNKYRPEEIKYYDMTVASGKILGSTNERIQSYPSDQIYNDYFIQLYSAPVVNIDSNFQITKITGDVKQVGTRVRIKDYDSYLGHMYLQTGQDGLSEKNLDISNVFQVFKMSNNPDDLGTKDKVDFCISQNYFVPKYFQESGSDSSAAYLSQTFVIANVTGSSASDTLEKVKDVYNKPFFANTDDLYGLSSSDQYYLKIFSGYDVDNSPPVIFGQSRVLLNTENNNNELDEKSGAVTGTKDYGPNGGSSKFNGIWIPKTPTVEKIAEHQNEGKYTGTDYKVTIQWYRSSDADTWGEITNKVVLDTNNFNSDYDSFAGQNLQAYTSEQEGEQVSTGTINDTLIKFNNEEPVEIYPNNSYEHNYGFIYKNNMDITAWLASITGETTHVLTYTYICKNTWKVTGKPKWREGDNFNDWIGTPIYSIEKDNNIDNNIFQEKHQYQILAYRNPINSYLQAEVKFDSNRQYTYYSGNYGLDCFNPPEGWKKCEIRVVWKNDAATDKNLDLPEVNDTIQFFIYDITTGIINFISPSTAVSVGDKIFNKDNSSSNVVLLDKTVWAIGQEQDVSTYKYKNNEGQLVDYNYYPILNFKTNDLYSIKTFFRSSSENQFSLYERPTVDLELYGVSGGAKIEINAADKTCKTYERSIFAQAIYNQTNLVQWRNYQWFLYDVPNIYENADAYKTAAGSALTKYLNPNDLILQSEVGYDKEIKYTFYGLAEEHHWYIISLVLTDQYGTIITKKIAVYTDFTVELEQNKDWVNYGLRCDLTGVDMWFEDKYGYIYPNLGDRNYLIETNNKYANNPNGVTYSGSVMNISDNSEGVLYDSVYSNDGLSSWNSPSKQNLTFDQNKGIEFTTRVTIDSYQYSAEFLNVVINTDGGNTKNLVLKPEDLYISSNDWPEGYKVGFPNYECYKIGNYAIGENPNVYVYGNVTTDLFPNSDSYNSCIKYNNYYISYIPSNVVPLGANKPSINIPNSWYFINYDEENSVKDIISDKPIKINKMIYALDDPDGLQNKDVFYNLPIFIRNDLSLSGETIENLPDGTKVYSLWMDKNDEIIIPTIVAINESANTFYYCYRKVNNHQEDISDNIWEDTKENGEDNIWEDEITVEDTQSDHLKNKDGSLNTIRNRLYGKVLYFYVQWSGKENDDITYGIVGNVSQRVIDVDSELSLTSVNPVENRVITTALNSKLDTTTLSDQNTFGIFKCYTDKFGILTFVTGEGENG